MDYDRFCGQLTARFFEGEGGIRSELIAEYPDGRNEVEHVPAGAQAMLTFLSKNGSAVALHVAPAPDGRNIHRILQAAARWWLETRDVDPGQEAGPRAVAVWENRIAADNALARVLVGRLTDEDLDYYKEAAL